MVYCWLWHTILIIVSGWWFEPLWLFPQYGKNVPKHQPGLIILPFGDSVWQFEQSACPDMGPMSWDISHPTHPSDINFCWWNHYESPLTHCDISTYPLVNVYITMENHSSQRESSQSLWPCPKAMWVTTRGYSISHHHPINHPVIIPLWTTRNHH